MVLKDRIELIRLKKRPGHCCDGTKINCYTEKECNLDLKILLVNLFSMLIVSETTIGG
jgi:uncharacterized protein (DUF779 family)